MNGKLMFCALAAVAASATRAVSADEAPAPREITVASPDGRTAIALSVQPLAYEVRRDGRVVAARAPIDMTIDGSRLAQDAHEAAVTRTVRTGFAPAPVYKKAQVDLAANEAFVRFGDWGVRLVARNDAVAYRFEIARGGGTVTVQGETASVAVPDPSATCFVYQTKTAGCEETVPAAVKAREIDAARGLVYLPFAYEAGGAFVTVAESDVREYPAWYLRADGTNTTLQSWFAPAPAKTELDEPGAGRYRRIKVLAARDCLVETRATRTFPWRVFMVADTAAGASAADAVWALAPEPDAAADFSWVRPGKVAWDWWNAFDNGRGCKTSTYERFIDFAAANGVEYVILDEGWSRKLDIWRFSPAVDVPHIIEYARARGVGIILWMAWAQAYGIEERVVEHFARLGARGFKVDFIDRADADAARFLERFAQACARHGMLVDYHGVYRPTGLERRFPNVLNYEGVHGLECMKWFKGDERGMMFSDTCAFFLRLAAGPMDYTPGAMGNVGIGSGYRGRNDRNNPCAVGTRCRQMAMMALYFAPLQMLCDAPTKYENSMECFRFMAATPVVWEDMAPLAGEPGAVAACARKAKDGAWYAAGIAALDAQDYVLDTAFLGAGRWRMELFRDFDDDRANAERYVHETREVESGGKIKIHLAPGGGFVAKFTNGAEG